MLARPHRLRRDRDIRRVYRLGRRFSNTFLVLNARWSGMDQLRCGFSAGKKLGSAVLRNRFKRRMRHALASRLAALAPGWDLAVSGKPSSATASFAELEAALEDLLHQAGLLAKARAEARNVCGT